MEENAQDPDGSDDRPWQQKAFEKMGALASACSDSIVMKDPDGRIVFANKSFCDRFCEDSEPVGLRAQDIIPEEIRELSELSDALVTRTRKPAALRLRRTVDGDHVQHFCTLKTPLFDSDFNLLAIVCVSYADDSPGPRMPNVPDALALFRAEKILRSFTPKQIHTLLLVYQGLMNKQIAKVLDISQRSVEAYRSKATSELGLDSTTQLVRLFSELDRNGLLPPLPS